MASIFAKIQKQAEREGIVPYTKKSREWFFQRLRTMRNVTEKKILNDDALDRRPKPLVGRMFMFQYEAKYANSLPYYDKFPLILMVEGAKGGFYGLNLHYLRPRDRAIFFDGLTEFLNNEKMNRTTRFRLSYGLLKSASQHRAFAPCFKRYLLDNMKSVAVEIPPKEWEIALFLPTENFVGNKTKEGIWRESKRNAGI
jgi:hypothetical protein